MKLHTPLVYQILIVVHIASLFASLFGLYTLFTGELYGVLIIGSAVVVQYVCTTIVERIHK